MKRVVSKTELLRSYTGNFFLALSFQYFPTISRQVHYLFYSSGVNLHFQQMN